MKKLAFAAGAAFALNAVANVAMTTGSAHNMAFRLYPYLVPAPMTYLALAD